MGRIFNKEQKEEFKDILETLGESLDITQTQYDNLVKSYKAVGDFLQNDPVFDSYKPIVNFGERSKVDTKRFEGKGRCKTKRK